MIRVLIIVLFIPLIGLSQFTDDFSDGDFTNNPAWGGNVEVFEVDTALKLHLKDTIANSSSLATLSECIINGEWIFNVKLGFSPSTNNYARVYLVSDEEDLLGNLNGYFVKIGGQTGAVDEISLYRQNGTSHTEIIDGIDGLATDNPDVKVRVTRDTFGNWELFLDTNGVFFSQGTAFDDEITYSEYFGVFCKYTITRSNKFWFDDVNISGFAAVYGCTDFSACNYDSLATADDGSCDLPNGCGDPLYLEYDPLVTCPDPLDCITLITTGLSQANNFEDAVKIFDILGRESVYLNNSPLFLIFKDGTVQKKIIIK